MPLSPSPLLRTARQSVRLIEPEPSVEWTPYSLAAGTVLDGYRILHPLGRGGMAVVYAAWDEANDRAVAVKVLGGAIDSPALLARFHREAAAVARVVHPGVVRLYAVGQTTAFSYLVMERVDGITLREWLARVPNALRGDPLAADAATPGPLDPLVRTVRFDITPTVPALASEPPPSRPAVLADPAYLRRVAVVLRELAAALAHAHAAGVTHRDLKPENVMVRPDGRVVVIDFGLARSFADTTLTTHSGLIGTPMYMAPEQLAGRPAGPQSDIYAVGLIGYELLTLGVPFRAGTVEGLLAEVLHRPPPPLLARNPAVPADLANVVHKAMAKEPAGRYATAGDLLADLDRHLSGGRVSAAGYRFRFDARPLTAARPKRVTLAGYAIVVVGALLTAFGVLAAALNSQPSALTAAATGGLFAVAARWLLTGRRGAWAGGCGVAAVLLGFVGWAVWQTFTLDLSHTPRILIAALIVTPAVAAGGLLVALLSPRARGWFRRVRAERAAFAADGKPTG